MGLLYVVVSEVTNMASVPHTKKSEVRIINTSEGKFAIRNVIKTPIGQGGERINPTRKGHYDVMPDWTGGLNGQD